MTRTPSEPAVRHFAEERLVDCECEVRLALPLLHHGRWSEVQFARCGGCGALQAYIPVGDDPRELNRAGANRAVPINDDVSGWLAQWPSLAVDQGDPIGPFWLPADARFADAVGLRSRVTDLVREQVDMLPAHRLRAAGCPTAPMPPVHDATIRVALQAMERVREALQGDLPADLQVLLGMLGDADPRRHVVLESLLQRSDMDRQLDLVHADGKSDPWRAGLLLLHWGCPREAQWLRYLQQLRDVSLTSVPEVDGLVRESFMLSTLLDALVSSSVPQSALHDCLRHLLSRSDGLDERLTAQIRTLTKEAPT
jgi:hypothetical protein